MKIKILSDSHSHKNKPLPSGSEIDVDDLTGQHLIAIGAAVAVSGRKESTDEHTQQR
jgi:hypothetical protein